ncbi:MAG: NUDIX domain-containing protein [Actinobacteria bacterium]|nr:NUDIX domain-containing protein [Actinomycetota bacterium]
MLDGYEPRDGREAEDVARMRALLTCPDPWSRAEPLHLTASALVLHRPTRRVLLRWHERMQRWMQVGGHGDPGERDPWAVALREAREETGLRDLEPLSPAHARRPSQLVIVPVAAHDGEPAHEHADVRYLLATATPDDARSETPGAPVRWLPLDEAVALVDETNLETFLQRAAEALGS